MTYQCQDPDCRAVITDDNETVNLRPLVMRFPARAYPAGSLGQKDGKPYPETDKSFPAYSVLKCPWCRGALIEVNPS